MTAPVLPPAFADTAPEVPLRRATKVVGVLAAVAAAALLAGNLPYLTGYFLAWQEIPAAIGLLAMFLALQRFLPVSNVRFAPINAFIRVWGIALVVFAIAAAGTWLVFRAYPVSMDEFWARADGFILATGEPMARIAPEWRPFAPALQPIFARLLPEQGLWASTYLPVNALIQHWFGDFASPLMAAASVMLAGSVARRLLPEDRTAPMVCAILLASSAQVIVTAMTPYAMTAHLMFNLLWLWLYLRSAAWAQLAAMAVCFAAIGLHQPVFFPIFAIPFLFESVLSGRRLWPVLHLVAIAAAFLAWSSYDLFAYHWFGAHPEAAASSGSGWLFGKLLEKLAGLSLGAVGVMAANLLRLVSWQNPLVAVLVLAVAWPLVRTPGPWRALLAGVALTIVFVALVIPYQGHGWGYRYVHGLLGNLALLATLGWTRVSSGAHARQWRGAFAIMLAISVAVLLPLRGYQAWRWTAPYAAANAALERWGGDVVVVDAPGHAFSIDLVRNNPLLDNVPKRMAGARLTDAQLAELCRKYDVRFFSDADASRFGLPMVAAPGEGRAPGCPN